MDFKPTPEGLHVMRCSKYFGEGKNGCVFGQNIPDNNTNFNDSMEMCNNSVGTLNNSHGIDTIKESKKLISGKRLEEGNTCETFSTRRWTSFQRHDNPFNCNKRYKE